MKTFILLLLSCLSVSAGTGIQVTSTSGIERVTGVVVTTDTYTRDGQRDLVRITKTRNGVVTYRSHAFYHDDKLVALFTWRPEESSFDVVPGTSCYVGLDFLPATGVKSLTIWGTDFIDGFYPTNNVYYPVPDSDLKTKPAQ